MAIYGLSSMPPPKDATELEVLFGASDPAFRQVVEGPLEAAWVMRDVARITRFQSAPFRFQSASVNAALGQSLSVKILIVREGTLRFDQWKTSLIAQRGDILMIANWIPFQITATHELDALLVDVPAWWAARELLPDVDMGFRFIIASEFFSAEAIRRLASAIYDLDGSPEHCSQALLMLSGLIRQSLPLNVVERSSTPAMAGRVGRILMYICQQIDTENLTPQAAAAALKCSVRTIHKTCSDAGTSFNNILTEMRLSFAAYRLATTNERVSQVAYSVGFVSLSHFCRLFKVRFGVSAGGYRQKYIL